MQRKSLTGTLLHSALVILVIGLAMSAAMPSAALADVGGGDPPAESSPEGTSTSTEPIDEPLSDQDALALLALELLLLQASI
ncbi:MAG: hypothetical protein KAT79_00495 [candidate division Zixibacteria bacterium]|nr:hypothetical protein [candidate division Zixibacteria bacterium]